VLSPQRQQFRPHVTRADAGANLFAASGKYESMGDDQLDDGAVFAHSVTDPEVFTIIFDRHYRTVYGYLARRVGRAVADDLAAETFVLAFERRAVYRPQAERALPWLLGIAVNLLAHHRRSEARQLRALAAAGSLEARPVAVPEAAADATSPRLVAGLEQLDDYDREALLLYAWAELRYEEIAQALGIPVGTVRSRLNRARRKLREALDPASGNVVQLRHEGAGNG
jgi:RNA polymerase sigma factor (sigma-70 family)